MSRKNLEKLDRNKNVISIEEFVTYYLNDGIPISCKKLTHKDLKSFGNPYVVTVSFEFASSNIELVFSNKLLLVKDGHHNLAPYINPFEIRKVQNLDLIDEEIGKLKKERIYQLSLILEHWNKLQVLLHRKCQIEQTIKLLEEINKKDTLEGMRSYVKKY